MHLTTLNGLSPKKAEALAKEGISTTQDLLFFFPRRYLDRSNVVPISQLRGIGEEVTVAGTVQSVDL